MPDDKAPDDLPPPDAVLEQTRTTIERIRARFAAARAGGDGAPPAAAAPALPPEEDTLTRLMRELCAVQERLERSGAVLRAIGVARRAHDDDSGDDGGGER